MHGKHSFVKAGLILTAIVLAFVFTRPAAGTEKNGTIHFYTIYGWGAYADSQYLQTFKSSMSAVVKNLGMKGVFNHYEEDKDFFKAISAPGDNIIQVGNREQLVIAITKYGYRPFMAYSFLGLKKNKCCLYVRKDSRFKSVEDLKGGSLTMSKNLIEYLSLRKMIGAKPERFFSSIDVVADGDAPAYTFSLERPDALWITVQQVRFLEVSNPSIVKGIRAIQCSEEHSHMPMLASPQATQALIDHFYNSFVHIVKGDLVLQYFPLAKYLNIKFLKVSVKDYKTTIDLYQNAKKKGWVDEYRKWIESQPAGKK